MPRYYSNPGDRQQSTNIVKHLGFMDRLSKAPRPSVSYLEVIDDDAGQRIDNFLTRRLKGVPKTRIYRALRRGEVRVNGRRVRPAYRVLEGDSIRVPPLRLDPAREASSLARHRGRDIERRIIHEDSGLLVIDKPAGLAVHGGSGISAGIIESLRASRPGTTLELVHRLDRATSGCMVVAKRRSALRRLHELLREGDMDKRYLALVAGRWPAARRLVDAPLKTSHRIGGERHVRVAQDGKPSRSEFRVVQLYREATLVEVRLLTGRTHQIRVHAVHAGHPVAGDDKYGDAELNARLRGLGLKHLFLHAHSLSFQLSEEAGPLSFDAPLPSELASVLDRLKPV